MKTNWLWFRSPLFEIEPGEDLETHPYRFGRQPARWLGERLRRLDYAVGSPSGEEGGWRVSCQQEPFRLWVECSTLYRPELYPVEGPLPAGRSVIWACRTGAEQPLLQRLFHKTDLAPAVERLNRQIRELLAAEAGAVFVAGEEDGR